MVLKALGFAIPSLLVGALVVFALVAYPGLNRLGWYDWLLVASLGVFDAWLLLCAFLLALSWFRRHVIRNGIAPAAEYAVRNVLPSYNVVLAGRLLLAAGVFAVLWSVGVVFLSRFDVFRFNHCVAIAAGVFAMANTVARRPHRYAKVSAGLSLCLLNGNFVSLGLGAIAMYLMHRRRAIVTNANHRHCSTT
jgi:hypothetical protein